MRKDGRAISGTGTGEPTLGALLTRAAASAHPDAGFVTPAGRTPWARVLAGAERLAAALETLGVSAGARVGVLADNSVEGVEIVFACALLGAASVPVNTRFGRPELRHVLADARLDAVVVTDHPEAPADFPRLLRDAVPGLTDAPDPTALRLDGLPELRLAAAVADHDVTGLHRLDDLRGERLAPRPVSADEVAVMVYTSGTTAHPRGCPLTHRAVVTTGVAVGRDRFRCGPADVLWDVLPLFHLSFLHPLVAILDAGGSFVTDRRFDPAGALDLIESSGTTVAFTCFPPVIDGLMAQPRFGEVFAGVRLMLNVGPPDTLRRIQARAPHTVQLTSYGSSEMSGIAATTGPDDPDDVRLGTNGRPLPGMEMATMDSAADVLLPTGEIGEIVVRGVGMFSGYWNDPGSSDDTGSPWSAGGWFRSGDLGLVDASGRVHYRGRLKDMIKVGGENVAALEVESVLAQHPAVAVAVVVSAPDPRYTEVPAAFVELRDGATATAEQLREHCAAALARFKVPRYVRFVREWPMSATKIQKEPLRRRLAEEISPEEISPEEISPEEISPADTSPADAGADEISRS